jgi:hypothetical protein
MPSPAGGVHLINLGAQRRTRIELEFAGNEDVAVGLKLRTKSLRPSAELLAPPPEFLIKQRRART